MSKKQQKMSDHFAVRPKPNVNTSADQECNDRSVNLKIVQRDDCGVEWMYSFDFNFHFIPGTSSQMRSDTDDVEMDRAETCASTSTASSSSVTPSATTEDIEMDVEDDDSNEMNVGAKTEMKVKFKIPAGFIELRVKNRKRFQCGICAKFPNIVKQFNPRKPLAIASEAGTVARGDILENHLQSECHKACMEADRISSLNIDDRPRTDMEISIQKANKNQITYVGKLMVQVYLDAKLLNLPAYNWPARYVCGEASHAYNPDDQSRPIIADNINLQYVNPNGYLELMTSIVNSYQDTFRKKIDDAWAVSLRVDGYRKIYRDFTHIDKIYVMAKIINLDGSAELLFIGVGEQTERKAIGLKNAVVETTKTFIQHSNDFLRKISFICTDGPNVNCGNFWMMK